MTEPYPPPTPEERQLRAARLAGSGGGLAPGLAPGAPLADGGFWRGRSAGLPNWAWVAGGTIIGIVALLWFFNRKKNSSSDGADYGSATVVDDSSGIATGQYESILAQIRDQQGIQSQILQLQQSH